MRLAPAPWIGDMPPIDAERTPGTDSKRRISSIARALSVEPKVILADEPTSMLDVSVRLGILNLLADEKDQRKLAALYITHDIATARYFAEETAVLYAGCLVEQGPSRAITETPQHPYTRLLIASVPKPAHKITGTAARRATEVPLRGPTTTGCPFTSRCPRATAICNEQMPGQTWLDTDHFVRCHNL